MSRSIARSGLTRAARRTVDLAGCEAGVSGRELHIDLTELGGLAGAAERSLAAEFFELLHGRSARNLKRCPYRSWRHRVDADALWRQLLRQRLYIVHGRRLGL